MGTPSWSDSRVIIRDEIRLLLRCTHLGHHIQRGPVARRSHHEGRRIGYALLAKLNEGDGHGNADALRQLAAVNHCDLRQLPARVSASHRGLVLVVLAKLLFSFTSSV